MERGRNRDRFISAAMVQMAQIYKFVREIAEKNGIETVYVLQPDLYSTEKHLHPHEEKLLRDYRMKYRAPRKR